MKSPLKPTRLLPCLALSTLAVLAAGCVHPPGQDVAGTAAHPAQAQARAQAARIETLEITRREPAFAATAFGDVGVYERITGIATVALDPRAPANQAIADLALAADADGLVRYQADVVMLRPRDLSKSSRTLIVDIPNRGNKLALMRLNDGANQFDTAEQAGNGWAMRQGHVLLWIGWQGDVPLGQAGQTVGTRFPVAREGGRAIVGTSREEFIFDDTAAVSRARLTYPAVAAEMPRAILTVAATPDAPPRVLPPSDWRFLDERQIEIRRPPDADGGAIYTLSYQARDPVVMGLGLAALRDIGSFIRSGQADAAGHAGWLAEAPPSTAIAMGISQSGRFLRDFIWQGFNTDVQGRPVFEGAMPIIAGSRKTYTNVRWAQPGRYSRQHEDHRFYGDQFPFSYATTTDPVSHRTDGIFKQCTAARNCPKTLHVDSSLEFWQARSSLLVTDGLGRAIPVPDNVRLYLMGSTQHGPAAQPSRGICQTLSNPAQQSATVRALLDRLVQWTTQGRPPPESAYPSVADHTLAAPDRQAVGFPDLSAIGVAFPRQLNTLALTDPTRANAQADPGKTYRILVPTTNADGIDAAAILAPEVQLPLATHTGWALRAQGFAQGQLCNLNGSMIPLAPTQAARLAAHDPRPALAERYKSKSDYLLQTNTVAEQLFEQGYLLEEDIVRAVADAKKRVAATALPD
ncbi:MAG: alpha/beta hydrolase domain-containing protein [Comamonas sp.]